MMLPVSDHLNVKQLDGDMFHFANTWAMALTVTALYRKQIIDFRKHFAMYGQSIRSVFSSRNGISIRMEDEWVDLLQNVILDIHRH